MKKSSLWSYHLQILLVYILPVEYINILYIKKRSDDTNWQSEHLLQLSLLSGQDEY